MKTKVIEYKDLANEHRLRVTAEENGQTLLPLEGYKNKPELISAAVRAAKAILKVYSPKSLNE